MGKRVGYIGPNKGVKFSNVTASGSGTQNLIVYYTDGESYTSTRYLQFVVNGSAAQVLSSVATAGLSAPATFS